MFVQLFINILPASQNFGDFSMRYNTNIKNDVLYIKNWFHSELTTVCKTSISIGCGSRGEAYIPPSQIHKKKNWRYFAKQI